MKWFDEAFDRLLFGVARRASDRQILALSILLYGGIGLAVPIVLGWSQAWFVAANVFGTMMAFSFLMVWIGVQVRAGHRRHLVDWTTDMRHLNAEEFEWFVGELFRRDGWKIEEVGRQAEADGGIDLRIRKGQERKLVQCKRWTSWQIGPTDVRAFAGVVTREGLPGRAGILVTLSDFTTEAVAEATTLGLTLIDGRELYAMVERVRRPESCPVCGAAMLLDRSVHGWWFRCLVPGCKGKRDIGRDPVRAVELLTVPPAHA